MNQVVSRWIVNGVFRIAFQISGGPIYTSKEQLNLLLIQPNLISHGVFQTSTSTPHNY
jgi:hypothetical protein